MPLLWASRLQGTPLPERVADQDLIWSLSAAAAANRLPVYLIGGDPGPPRARRTVCKARTRTCVWSGSTAHRRVSTGTRRGCSTSRARSATRGEDRVRRSPVPARGAHHRLLASRSRVGVVRRRRCLVQLRQRRVEARAAGAAADRPQVVAPPPGRSRAGSDAAILQGVPFASSFSCRPCRPPRVALQPANAVRVTAPAADHRLDPIAGRQHELARALDGRCRALPLAAPAAVGHTGPLRPLRVDHDLGAHPPPAEGGRGDEPARLRWPRGGGLHDAQPGHLRPRLHPGGFGLQGDRVSAQLQGVHRAVAARARAVLVTDAALAARVDAWGGRGLVFHEAPGEISATPAPPLAPRPAVPSSASSLRTSLSRARPRGGASRSRDRRPHYW